MSILQTQEERLSFLVEEFKEDSTSYKELETPADTAGVFLPTTNNLLPTTH